jgi:hypothetical protein
MIRNILFVSLWSVLLFYSCIDDDSTLPIKDISEITIKAQSDTINIDFGYELVFEPEIEQTMKNMELTYEWSYHGYVKSSIGGFLKDSLRFLSNEKVLRHAFKKLGEYKLRLKVSNAHGSSYKYYTLFVKAAFDQGIFVLSANDEKKGRISFMRPLSREEIEAGKEETFYTSAFRSVNPAYELNDPVDAKKIGPDIFIASWKDKIIYRIDAQTFDMYNITDFKSGFDWMQPMAICSKDRSIKSYLVLSTSGGIAKVDYTSDIAYDGNVFWENHPPMNKLYEKITGEPIPPSTSVSKMRCYNFFLNYEESALYYIYDLMDYYAYRNEYPDDDLINVVMDKNTMSCLVSRKKENPNQIVVTRGYASNKGGMTGSWVYTYEADRITLTRESIMQSNDAYNSIFYTNKNKLYRWYNWNASPVLPETPVISLDENCEITCFSFTPDSKRLYLGIYNSRLPDLKGSVYVYDADALDPETNQLKLIKKYEGIADKPIKVFWKNNRK